MAKDGRRPRVDVPHRGEREKFLVFGAPLIEQEEIDEVVDTLRSGWIGFGPKCLKFEEQFASYVGAATAISVGSCTAALHLVLLANGIGPGDEVITTPLTFAATVNAIELVGARPVFADVDRQTQNIDPAAIAAAVTPRTRAVIPVHMAGHPCDLEAINGLSERHDLLVVDDAAHSVEAVSRAGKVGSATDFSVFSFYATKNLTTGEGGMITTSNPECVERIRRLRLHGMTSEAWERYSDRAFRHYEVVEPGYKYNMTDIQASLGIHQLARVERSLLVRERHWAAYDNAFKSLGAVQRPAPVEPGERHARHLYTMQLCRDIRFRRDEILGELRGRNIGCGVHFTPVHLHPYYAEKYGYRRGMFPVAEYIGAATFSLPLSAALTTDDVEDVIDAVRGVLGDTLDLRDEFVHATGAEDSVPQSRELAIVELGAAKP